MAGVVKLTHYVLEWGTPEKGAGPMKMGRWWLLGTPPQEVGLGHKMEKRCSLPHFTPRTVLVVLVPAVRFQPFFVLLFRPWRPLYMCSEFSLIVPCFRSFALPGSHSPVAAPGQSSRLAGLSSWGTAQLPLLSVSFEPLPSLCPGHAEGDFRPVRPPRGQASTRPGHIPSLPFPEDTPAFPDLPSLFKSSSF